MKTWRVGFVGFGLIGRVHACGYANLPYYYGARWRGRFRITHICTSRRESAEEGCTLTGAEYAVTDFRWVTENPDVDIVHICSPNHHHVEALLSAMAHQKHIYCEKPLTATLAEADQVSQALRSYRGTAQMTLQNRFFPATLRARQLVESGFLGRVLEFRASYLHASNVDPNTPLRWKLSGEAGGGVIADLGPHILDLVHFLLGDYLELNALTQVAYADRPSPNDPMVRMPVDAEDSAQLLVRLTGGATGVVEASKLATGTEDEVRVEIHGSRGALRFNGMNPHFLEIFDASAPDQPAGGTRGWTQVTAGQRYPPPATGFPTPKAAIGWIRAHLACLANFLHTVEAGHPGNPGLDQGIYLQHLIECARRSAQERRWIQVDARYRVRREQSAGEGVTGQAPAESGPEWVRRER